MFCGMRDLPRPGTEPSSSALAGGFFSSEPPGKPQYLFLFVLSLWTIIYLSLSSLKMNTKNSHYREINLHNGYNYFLFTYFLKHYITTNAIVAGSNTSVSSIKTGVISGSSFLSLRTNSLPFNFITVARSVSAWSL